MTFDLMSDSVDRDHTLALVLHRLFACWCRRSGRAAPRVNGWRDSSSHISHSSIVGRQANRSGVAKPGDPSIATMLTRCQYLRPHPRNLNGWIGSSVNVTLIYCCTGGNDTPGASHSHSDIWPVAASSPYSLSHETALARPASLTLTDWSLIHTCDKRNIDLRRATHTRRAGSVGSVSAMILSRACV